MYIDASIRPPLTQEHVAQMGLARKINSTVGTKREINCNFSQEGIWSMPKVVVMNYVNIITPVEGGKWAHYPVGKLSAEQVCILPKSNDVHAMFFYHNCTLDS
jgi:hypothetical protein